MTKSEILEIKEFLQTEGGHRVSLRKGKGSQSGYVIFQIVGKTKEWSFDFRNLLLEKYEAPEPRPTFVTNGYQLALYVGDELKNYDFKRKRSKIVRNGGTEEGRQLKPCAWGKAPDTRQLRLDKAARRYGARVRRGDNTVGYY